MEFWFSRFLTLNNLFCRSGDPQPQNAPRFRPPSPVSSAVFNKRSGPQYFQVLHTPPAAFPFAFVAVPGSQPSNGGLGTPDVDPRIPPAEAISNESVAPLNIPLSGSRPTIVYHRVLHPLAAFAIRRGRLAQASQSIFDGVDEINRKGLLSADNQWWELEY